MRHDFAAMFKPKVKEGIKLLDLGCGDKGKTAWAKGVGAEVVFIDAWPDVNPDHCIDVTKEPIPYPDNHFDIVMMYDFIEHVTKEEGYEVIKEAQRVCGGEIILVTPIIWSDNAHNVNNPNLWCYGNEYDYHKSLWVKEDFDALGGWTHRPDGHDATKYYCGIWTNPDEV